MQLKSVAGRPGHRGPNGSELYAGPARHVRGFSLPETLIGLALLATLMAGGMQVMNRADQQTNGRATGDSIGSMQQLAAQYFVANRVGIEAAMNGDVTKQATHCLINVPASGTGGTVAANSTKHTCAFDSTLLVANKLWPSGASVNTSTSGRYVAIVRQVLDSSGTPTGADEMLIVLAPLNGGNVMSTGTVAFTGDAQRAIEEISASMAALGATGGYVPPGQDTGPCKYNGTTKQVCGNGWKVTLSDFVD